MFDRGCGGTFGRLNFKLDHHSGSRTAGILPRTRHKWSLLYGTWECSIKLSTWRAEADQKHTAPGYTGNPLKADGLLIEIFCSETLPLLPEIERTHRSLRMKPTTRLWPVIIGQHHYQTKDLLIRKAHRRGKLEFWDQPIWVFRRLQIWSSQSAGGI